MITRKLHWISSIDPARQELIHTLEKKLAAFYAGNPDYYGEINFTAENWVDKKERGYQQILAYTNSSNRICEVGCGSANILKHFPVLQQKYRGCDFSESLITQNRQKYPGALFDVIREPNQLPYPDREFDLLFSVFVLEHSTRPARLLDECERVLQPGGRLVILCPDFLGKGRLSSQRAGWSEGNSKDKFRKGKYLDALVTLFDNRIKIPLYCRLQKLISSSRPQFLVNLYPTVFEDRFYPDVDAVYLTHQEEIIKHLRGRFSLEPNSSDIEKYTLDRKIIFLSFIKTGKPSGLDD